MKRYINIKIIGITVLVTFIFLVTRIVQMNKTSMDIIGGADGPTAIFLASPEKSMSTLAFVFAVILFVVITLVAKFVRKQ